MDTEQRDKWIADYADISQPLEASATLKQALPQAARVVVSILSDDDASPRLKFDAAKYVIEQGLPTGAATTANPWDGLLDDIKADVQAGNEEAEGE